MSNCDHEWIGDTCVECGVDWNVYARSTITTLQREVESLRGELDARIDACTRAFLKNKYLQGELESIHQALNHPTVSAEPLACFAERHHAALKKAKECLEWVRDDFPPQLYGVDRWNQEMILRTDASLRAIKECGVE